MSSKLKPNTILTRSKDITIRFSYLHEITLAVNGVTGTFDNKLLTILEVFAKPQSFQEALKKLEAVGLRDWIGLTAMIQKLYQIGALCPEGESKFIPHQNKHSFSSLPIHIKMLNDKTRTNSFIKAIHKTVKKGDIVIDIGTGTGILAIAAARAGAKKVYAIEGGGMADVAQKIIAQNGLSDKIEILRGWSTQINLPEKADVLVSEIIGNDPFAERVLETFSDTKQRLLKPDALILPNSMKVYGLPVSIPESWIKNKRLSETDIKNWFDWYQIDYSDLNHPDYQHKGPLLMLDNKKIKKLKICGKPMLLAEVDFLKYKDIIIDNTITAQAESPFNGILVYFELGLGAFSLTNNFLVADKANSWLTPVWYLEEGAFIQVDSPFIINYRYGKEKTGFSAIWLI